MTDITVVIPVGPHEANQRWLPDCLESVKAQTHAPAEVLLIADGAKLDFYGIREQLSPLKAAVWATPWLSGVAHAFNFGVALCPTELVVMLGSDDLLEPWCLENCAAAWERWQDPLGYYSLDVRYMDTGETQSIACNAAMVSKALWRHTGGFPVQSAIGAPDTMLLSIMMKHGAAAGNIRRVRSDRGAPYLYRRHPETDTARNYWRFQEAITQVRNTLTQDWRPLV